MRFCLISPESGRAVEARYAFSQFALAPEFAAQPAAGRKHTVVTGLVTVVPAQLAAQLAAQPDGELCGRAHVLDH